MSETDRTPQNQNPQRSRKEHWYRRIFDALVPATRAKIQHSERHIFKAINEQIQPIQNKLSKTLTELEAIRNEIAEIKPVFVPVSDKNSVPIKNGTSKIHTFDIWGCCVSRDTFGNAKDEGNGIEFPARQNLENIPVPVNNFAYQINNYYAENSIHVAFSPRHGERINENSTELDIPQNSWRKWFLASYNKGIPEILQNSTSEWLVVDFHTESYPAQKINNIDGTSDFMAYNRAKIGNFYKFLTKQTWVKNLEISNPSTTIDFNTIEQFINFAQNRYGKKIILIDVIDGACELDENGKINPVPMATQNVEIKRQYTNYFYKRTHCHLIKSPGFVPRDALHKWGKGSVHFISEYYDYLFRAIQIITSETPNEEIKLSELFCDINEKIAKICHGGGGIFPQQYKTSYGNSF